MRKRNLLVSLVIVVLVNKFDAYQEAKHKKKLEKEVEVTLDKDMVIIKIEV